MLLSVTCRVGGWTRGSRGRGIPNSKTAGLYSPYGFDKRGSAQSLIVSDFLPSLKEAASIYAQFIYITLSPKKSK